MSEIKVNKISPSTGTEMTLGDNLDDFLLPSGAEIKAKSGSTITIESGATLANAGTATGFAGDAFTSGAMVYPATNLTLTNSTETLLLFASETYDTDSIHDTSTNTGRFTIPAEWTYVMLGMQVTWISNSSGYRRVSLRKNGTAGFAGAWDETDSANTASHLRQTFSTGPIPCAENDYFDVVGWQNSGGNLNMGDGSAATWFWIWRLA